jgi:hypothetical protein
MFGKIRNRADCEETAQNRADGNTLENDQRVALSREEIRAIHHELKTLSDSNEHERKRKDFLLSEIRAEGLHLAHLKQKRPFYGSREDTL